ncbi:hypothetical protein LMK04_12320 (plasmid) [Lactococcus petauri]|jgi:hypothetical protein|nr:hypothetical protein LMK04_12320 [Lactococcus petauri]
MKKKTKLFIAFFGGLTLLSFTVPKVAEAFNLSSNDKLVNSTYSNNIKQNLAIKIALQDFSSLEDFNKNFLDYDSSGNTTLMSDDTFLIPDTLADYNDTEKQHGWNSFPSEKDAEDISVYDESTGHTSYQSKSDGATIKEIRKALSDRDASK